MFLLKTKRGKAGHRSGDEVGGHIGSKANHGKASILEFLHTHLLFLFVRQFIPLPEPIDNGFSLSNEGFAV